MGSLYMFQHYFSFLSIFELLALAEEEIFFHSSLFILVFTVSIVHIVLHLVQLNASELTENILLLSSLLLLLTLLKARVSLLCFPLGCSLLSPPAGGRRDLPVCSIPEPDSPPNSPPSSAEAPQLLHTSPKTRQSVHLSQRRIISEH